MNYCYFRNFQDLTFHDDRRYVCKEGELFKPEHCVSCHAWWRQRDGVGLWLE